MLIPCPVPEKAKSHKLIDAFIRGAPRDRFGFVFYGVKASNLRNWRIARDSGEPWYWIDNSYFDATRGQRFRVTKNRLQVNARELDSDCKRFDALGLEIKPWRSVPDGYWLAVHQSDDHLHAAPEHKAWMTEAVRSLGQDRPIVHRHWDANKMALAASLPRALEGAYGLVTHTSAAAVTAVLAGVHCLLSESHALAGMVCGYGDRAHLDQRRRFLGVLADHEFDISELENGTAWRTLHP